MKTTEEMAREIIQKTVEHPDEAVYWLGFATPAEIKEKWEEMRGERDE